MVASSSNGPLSQVPERPRVMTPLHTLCLGRDIPFQFYKGFEFQGGEPLPPHRFDTMMGVTIQSPSREWALDAFKLGGDLSGDCRLNSCLQFMSGGDFVNTKELKHFFIRNLTNEMERSRGINFDDLGNEERLRMKDEELKVAKVKFIAMTPLIGREIVKRSGVLLLQGWDISSSIVFDES